jgi:hypothetical protein
MEENTAVSVCIGTFDPTGIPITITRHLSDATTIGFQAITLNLLLAKAFNLKAAETTEIFHQEGSSIRLDRTLKGFTGYISTQPTHKS